MATSPELPTLVDKMPRQSGPADILFRVTGPNFVAGVIACNGRVVHCAPILRKLGFLHCTGRQFAALCDHHGFTWERLPCLAR